jgi:hypothetical protein
VTLIVDQASPIPTSRRPAWDLVIEHVRRRRASMAVVATTIDLVLEDMLERDRLGRARYGTPLTSGNGRDHLIDAYQEALDLAAYLAAELDEHAVGLDDPVPARDDSHWRMIRVQSMLWDHVRTIVALRALIEERAS